MGRSQGVLQSVVVLILTSGLVLTSSFTVASDRPEIGFYSWSLEPNDGYVSDYVPPAAMRYEYRGSPVWYVEGWAPGRLDVALDAGSEWRWSQEILQLQVRLRVKVSRPRVDPSTGLTDFSAMARDARWRSVLTKRIRLRGFDADERIHLVSDLAFNAILEELWERDEWPLELQAEVRVSRAGHGQAPLIVTGRMGIIPGG